jgi:hypothetical protein
VGDLRHRTLKSDHNPDSRGVVRAGDVTHDPANGVDCAVLYAAIVARRDHRVRYTIWRGVITYGPHADSVLRGTRKAWTSEPYRGTNPHTLHLHVSIGHNARCEEDESSWWELPRASRSRPDPKATPQHNPATRALRLTKPLMRGTDVAFVQRSLKVSVDGFYGPNTVDAVRAYQRKRKLSPDGIVGPNTWKRLMA